MQPNSKYIITLALLFLSLNIFSQEKKYFEARDFGSYFLSDVYSPATNISAGLTTNSDGYNIIQTRNEEYIPVLEITMGVDLPIYQYIKDKHYFSFSFPISFRLWWDFFERKVTCPILNTDYRVGAEINYIYLLDKGFIKNIGLKFQPGFHESCHIGDELTIYRTNNNLPIKRVDLSYDAADLALIINDNMSEIKNNLSLKLGIKALLAPKRGWYFLNSNDADTTKLDISSRWLEPYFQLEYQKANNFLTTNKLMFVFSADARLRVKFGYPYYSINHNDNLFVEHSNSETYSLSVNCIAGWKIKGTNGKRSRFGLYCRYYRGVNPYGQFRNMNNEFMGLSIIYE